MYSATNDDDYKSFTDQDMYIDQLAEKCETVKELILDVKDEISKTYKTPADYLGTEPRPSYALISEVEYTELDSEPGFLFEDIEELDSALLNKYENGVKFNKDYIFDLWKHMESLTLKEHWDIRFDSKFAS